LLQQLISLDSQVHPSLPNIQFFKGPHINLVFAQISPSAAFLPLSGSDGKPDQIGYWLLAVGIFERQ
jgi:hypothetical protein